MSDFSDSMVALAKRLLTKFGQSVTFTRSTVGAFDPATSTVGAPSVSNYSGLVSPQDYTQTEKTLEHIQQGDIKLITEQTTTTPIVGDVVSVDSIDYRIMDVEKVVASGVTCIYILQVRI